MPLRDHFHPPLSNKRSWDALHGGWPMVIVMDLNNRLPPSYLAEPQIHLGANFEIDVATSTQRELMPVVAEDSTGGTATAVWAPPEPTLAVPTDLPDVDEYEVRVIDTETGRLVAAIEMVSPANKDRPETRRAFAAKCETLLHQGVSVTIVDLVTLRGLNLYGDLLDLIGQTEEALGREAFGDLFSFIRTVFRKLKLKGTVLSEFKEYVVAKVPDSKKLIDDVLIPYADAYSDIKGSSYESAAGAEEVNKLFHWLNRIDNTDWMPPAILFLSRNRNDPKALQKFFTDLERLSAVLMLLRSSINERIERLGKIVTAIEKGDDLYKDGSPLQLTATEMIDAAVALDGDVYNLLAPLRSYLLLRLDSLLSGGGATYDYDLITVEHVLPQTPDAGSQWEKWFPAQADRDSRVHRLGNLALLTRRKNSSAKNYEFDKKKSSYFAKGGVSPFAITTQVLHAKDWTPAVVDKRQADLLGKMEALWRL